ncbi:MAG TPA: trypsin-like peptidase domain-containing protein [Acidimicrobiia bacterium]
MATVAALALAWGVAATAVAIRNRDNNSGPSLSSRNSFRVPSNGSSSGSLNVNAIASKVSPGVVNISTDLSQGNEAAGTGIVLTSDGEVLTNNHVIRGATKLSVEIGVTGETHDAHVVGYDVADDVALVKVDNVSNLNPVKLANSSNVNTNDPIVAIGNALGRGGTPTAVGGVVTDLGQTITAGDRGDATDETLTNMIQIQAPIQPGDSGGPLVDASGKVIGMTTAADSTPGFGQDTSGNTGFAIPINKAKGIADQIADGQASTNVHIGPRALLGVSTSDQDTGNQGAYVEGVESGSGADNAGIHAQDTVTAINGNDVGSAESLRAALSTLHPGDSVRVTYVGPDGGQHQATVKLGTGTPD